jgi:hypothetical protein
MLAPLEMAQGPLEEASGCVLACWVDWCSSAGGDLLLRFAEFEWVYREWHLWGFRA